MATRQAQVPGGAYVNETRTQQEQVPGYQFINEPSSTGGGGGGTFLPQFANQNGQFIGVGVI
jgi:hypothetical protein